MNQRSKIARLPKSLRHQLGFRIEDNHSGVDLVQWLNSLPEVQKIIADQFDGSPISEQNLSAWKSSGHLDWLRHEAAVESARQFVETSDDLDQAAQHASLPDRFAAILAVELMRTGMILLEKETDPEKKWKLACQLNRELSRLRRDNDRGKRTALEQANPHQAANRQETLESYRAKATSGSNLVTQALENLSLTPATGILNLSSPASTLQPFNVSTLPLKTPINPGKSSLVKANQASLP